MMQCRKNRKLFVEALYGELTGDQKIQFENHIDHCQKCEDAYQTFLKTQNVLNQRTRFEPDETFWTGYTNRMVGMFEKELKRSTKPHRRFQHILNRFSPQRVWILGPAVAVSLVILGVWIGRISMQQIRSTHSTERRMAGTTPANVKKVSIDERAQRYLGRSKILLLGLVNFDPKTDDATILNLGQQQRISQELVHEAGYLKEELNEPGQKQLRSLIADLEVILLQIANLESQNDLPAVEMVRCGVDSRGILLKIQLEEMSRTKNKDAQASKDRNSELSI